MQTIANLLPEIFLALAIVFALFLELLAGHRASRALPWFGVLALLFVAWTSVRRAVPGLDVAVAGDVLRPDFLTVAVRVLACAAGVITLTAATGSREMERHGRPGEFTILAMGLVLGAMVFASAANLLTLYVGLEFLSLTGYALAGLRVGSRSASEAGLKYVLFGGISSALMLFGMSHLFGLAGSLDIATIGQKLASVRPEPALLVPLLLVGVGFAYKLALVPFHFWSPDVYQGCPRVSAAILTTVPKLAGFIGLLHFLQLLLGSGSLLFLPSGTVATFVAVLAMVTMLVGAFTALSQSDARRILAFSSVTNAGVMLLAVGNWNASSSMAALLFYFTGYLFANMGAFLALDWICDDGRDTSLSELSGAWSRHPYAVLSLSLCVLSLVGLPPFAGFLGKWNLLKSVLDPAINQGGRTAFLWAAFAVVASSVVLAFAYLRIVRAAVVSDEESQPREEEADYRPSGESPWALILCVTLTVVLGAGWPLLDLFSRWLMP